MLVVLDCVTMLHTSVVACARRHNGCLVCGLTIIAANVGVHPGLRKVFRQPWARGENDRVCRPSSGALRT